MSGSLILEVPGEKEREKASALAAWLKQALDPITVKVAAPTRMAELRITRIGISVGKEELQDTLARARGCKAIEVQVEDRTSRGGLGSVWKRCPTATARKLSHTGRILVVCSMARVETIPKRPSRCYRHLELGHVRVTCESTVNRGQLYYRCGDVGHQAKICPASVFRCRLCESLGALATRIMGGAACVPPKTKEMSRIRGLL